MPGIIDTTDLFDLVATKIKTGAKRSLVTGVRMANAETYLIVAARRFPEADEHYDIIPSESGLYKISDEMFTKSDALPTQAARTQVCDEIVSIMEEYDRQDARGFVDTPGGLEHMGDVWRQLDKWRSLLQAGGAAP